MIPIESLDAFGGQAGLEEKVKGADGVDGAVHCAGRNRAVLLRHGERALNNGGRLQRIGIWAAFSRSSADRQGGKPQYRLVLQRAPENILWNSWNSALVSAAQGGVRRI